MSSYKIVRLSLVGMGWIWLINNGMLDVFIWYMSGDVDIECGFVLLIDMTYFCIGMIGNHFSMICFRGRASQERCKTTARKQNNFLCSKTRF